MEILISIQLKHSAISIYLILSIVKRTLKLDYSHMISLASSTTNLKVIVKIGQSHFSAFFIWLFCLFVSKVSRIQCRNTCNLMQAMQIYLHNELDIKRYKYYLYYLLITLFLTNNL